MALPQSNTERWFLTYSVAATEHTMMMRTEEGTSASAVTTAFDAFLDAIAPTIAEVAILSLEKADINSDVRNPAVWGGAPNYGTGTLPATYTPVELTFPGRTTAGHKSRVSFFGYDGAIEEDYRFTVGENADLDAARETLDDYPGRWLGIDGNAPIWHPYVNIGFNDHWVKKSRSGGA